MYNIPRLMYKLPVLYNIPGTCINNIPATHTHMSSHIMFLVFNQNLLRGCYIASSNGSTCIGRIRSFALQLWESRGVPGVEPGHAPLDSQLWESKGWVTYCFSQEGSAAVRQRNQGPRRPCFFVWLSTLPEKGGTLGPRPSSNNMNS